MTICHEMRFISKIYVSLHEKSHNWLINLVCDQEYRTVASNFLHLCQFRVCSDKSQLSNYVNAHCLQISIWTWFMSYHVETTLCHDITTYDILWQPYKSVSFADSRWSNQSRNNWTTTAKQLTAGWAWGTVHADSWAPLILLTFSLSQDCFVCSLIFTRITFQSCIILH